MALVHCRLVKLWELIIIGDCKEFFQRNRCLFRNRNNESVPECIHMESDYTVEMPRYRCCRVRQARLLIIDQLLHVLRIGKKRFHRDKSIRKQKVLVYSRDVNDVSNCCFEKKLFQRNEVTSTVPVYSRVPNEASNRRFLMPK